jgi:hypothetical protein
MKAFFSLYFAMEFCNKFEIEDYWSLFWLTGTIAFKGQIVLKQYNPKT